MLIMFDLPRTMERRVFLEILSWWVPIWVLGAWQGLRFVEEMKRPVNPVKLCYVINAMSLCLICSVPAWIIGLPPNSSWKYDLGIVTLLVISIVSGYVSSALVVAEIGLIGHILAIGQCTFALLMFCLPLAITAHESYTVFKSAVAVPTVTVQDCGQSGIYEFAQLSDLHIVGTGSRTRDNSRSGDIDFPDAISTVHSVHPEFVFVTGDMTDGGEENEWSVVTAALQKLSTTSFVVMSPGNHDMNLIFQLNYVMHDYVSSETRRIQRFFVSQTKLNPRLATSVGVPLARVVAESPQDPSQIDLEQERARASRCMWSCESVDPLVQVSTIACKTQCASDAQDAKKYPSFGRIASIEEYWQNVGRQSSFPLIERHDRRVVIVLGTVFTAPTIVGQNALGGLDSNQLGRFDEILQTLSPDTKEIYILAHHPFTRPDDEKLEIPPMLSLSAWYNSKLFAYSLLGHDSEQARKVVSLIDRTAAAHPTMEFFILFGHRHTRSLARRDNVIFLESPNLATDEPSWHGFFAKTESSTTPCWFRMK